MIYDDDQCAQCGAIRAPKSTLCVDCLAVAYEDAVDDNYRKANKIAELEEKRQKAATLCDRLLEHISAEAIYVTELRIKLLRAERGRNDKDGME